MVTYALTITFSTRAGLLAQIKSKMVPDDGLVVSLVNWSRVYILRKSKNLLCKLCVRGFVVHTLSQSISGRFASPARIIFGSFLRFLMTLWTLASKLSTDVALPPVGR